MTLEEDLDKALRGGLTADIFDRLRDGALLIKRCMACGSEYRILTGPKAVTEVVELLEEENGQLRDALLEAHRLLAIFRAVTNEGVLPPRDGQTVEWVESWLEREEVAEAVRKAQG